MKRYNKEYYQEKYKNYKRENTFLGWVKHIKLVLISMFSKWFGISKKIYYIRFMQPKESKSNTHFWISLVKSGFRIGAGITLWYGDYMSAGALLIIAEALGIAEEIF